MSIDALRQALPAYAADLGANLDLLAGERVMSDTQKWGAFVASAYAAGAPQVIAALRDGCPLSEAALAAAKAAAATMAMNNVYYRAVHVMQSREYEPMPVKLKMGAIADPGVAKIDFELWCLAVSAINGCAACLDGHEKALRTRGVSGPVIQAAIRIAAVVNAVSRVMIAEAGERADERGG